MGEVARTEILIVENGLERYLTIRAKRNEIVHQLCNFFLLSRGYEIVKFEILNVRARFRAYATQWAAAWG